MTDTAVADPPVQLPTAATEPATPVETKNEIPEKVEAAAPLREDMINNAIKFLSHATVVNTPLVRRVAFLEQKGLTSAEITEALRRSSQPAGAAAVAAPIGQVQQSQPQVIPQIQLIAPAVPPPPPQRSAFKQIGTTLVIALAAIGGGTWLMNSFIKRSMETLKVVNTQNREESQQQQQLQNANNVNAGQNAQLATQMTQLVQEIKTQRTEVKDTLKLVQNVLNTPEKFAPAERQLSQVNIKELTNAINELQSVLKENRQNDGSNSAPSTPKPQLSNSTSNLASPFTPKPSPITTSSIPKPSIVSPPTANVNKPAPTRSFDEIMRMVQEGEEIPGIDPNINDSPVDPTAVAQKSETKAPVKPWEARRDKRKAAVLSKLTQTPDSPTIKLPAYLQQQVEAYSPKPESKIEVVEEPEKKKEEEEEEEVEEVTPSISDATVDAKEEPVDKAEAATRAATFPLEPAFIIHEEPVEAENIAAAVSQASDESVSE